MSRIHKAYFLIAILFSLVILFEMCVRTSPFDIEEKEVYRIKLGIEYHAESKAISGEALIEDKEGIKETIDILNKIQGYRGFYSRKDLPGDSPSAIITIYSSESDVIGHTSMIYYNFIVPEEETYYKIKTSEHNKIAELCHKYGKCRSEEY